MDAQGSLQICYCSHGAANDHDLAVAPAVDEVCNGGLAPVAPCRGGETLLLQARYLAWAYHMPEAQAHQGTCMVQSILS